MTDLNQYPSPIGPESPRALGRRYAPVIKELGVDALASLPYELVSRDDFRRGVVSENFRISSASTALGSIGIKGVKV